MRIIEVSLSPEESECHQSFTDCLDRGYGIQDAAEWVREHIEAADKIKDPVFWTWLVNP